MAVATRRRRTASAGVLLALLAAAFNMRVGVVEVGPVIEDIRADTGMSSALAGVLTTMVFVCQGVFSIAGVTLLRRHGPERLIALSLLLLGAGTALRGVLPSPLLLILGTLPIGIGIALIAISLPGVVKEHYPQRAGAITGAYVSSLSVGAAIVALGIVPASDALGGWRPAFVASALLVVPALVCWAPSLRRPRPAAAVGGSVPSLRLSRIGVLLGFVFGTQSICFSATITWAAALYRAQGWDRGDAAVATAALPLATIVVALIVPRMSDRGGRTTWVAVMAGFMGIGLLGMALAPESLGLGWVLIFGLANGAIFPLLLTLPLDLRSSPSEVLNLSAWMQGIGYAMTATGPPLVGALRDATGSFRLAFVLLSGLAVTCLALSLLVRRAARPA